MRWLLQLHCSASSNLARDEGREAAKLVAVVKSFLWARAKTLVRTANGQPVLFSYGSDGTPLLTKESVAIRPTAKTVLYRRATQSGEYLVERGFLLTKGTDGGCQSACLVREPRLLTEGKTALHMFNSMKSHGAASVYLLTCRSVLSHEAHSASKQVKISCLKIVPPSQSHSYFS